MFKFVAIGAALALTIAGAASAMEPLEPLADTELEEQRGRFIMIDGLALDFSAVAESYVGGEMVLRSTLTWTQQGAVVTYTGAATEATAPDALAALAAAGIVLSPEMLSDGGLFVTADGQTAFVHRINEGAVANLLVNVGNGGDFYQRTSITLGLPGFDATQAGMREALAVRALASEIQAGLAAAY